MGKFVTGMALGIFVGAVAVEIISRTRPELMDEVRSKVRRAGDFVDKMTSGRAGRAVRRVY